MEPLKRLERAIKNVASATMRRWATRRAIPTLDGPIRSIAILRQGGLGDMILTAPILRAVRTAHPQARIEVVCDPENAAPLDGSGLADRVHLFDKRLPPALALAWKLRRARHDVIVNLVLYPSFTFGLLARLAGPRSLRIGGDQERYGFFYNREVALPPKRAAHMLERMRMVASELIDERPMDIEPPWLALPAAVGDAADDIMGELRARLDLRGAARVALVNIAAGEERREWDPARLVDLLRVTIPRLAGRIDGWALLDPPGRAGEAARVCAAVGDARLVVAPVIHDFRVVIELVARAALVLTPDTSVAHSASATGTPLVDLLIGENAVAWAPLGASGHAVVSDDAKSLVGLKIENVARALEAATEQR